MRKLCAATALCLLAFVPSALAGTKVWQVTEETDSGIKGGQGSWKMTTEGDKITGTADLTLDDGTPLTYKVEGTVNNGVYTINLVDRSDGKKGCIWTGHVPSGGTQLNGLVGWAPCQGGKLIIRAGG